MESRITLHDRLTHKRSSLSKVQDFFGVGYIAKHKLLSNQFRVSKLKDLEVLINHFNKLPLITQKCADYELWQKVYNLMLLKQHLTANGLRQIIAIKASMNLGLSYKLKKAFPPQMLYQSLDQLLKISNLQIHND